jgi:DNA/RNA endonuclease G (NUC1)
VSVDSIGIASNLSRLPIPDNYVSNTLAPADFSQATNAPFLLGRLVPLLNFAGTPFWRDINYSSNGIPISRSLNTGAWNGLDWSIRNLVNRVGQVFVLAGPIYFKTPQVENLETAAQHQVPDAYFKIVVSDNGASSVFIMNQDVPIHTHHCSLGSTMDEVERLTGLKLLPELNKSSGDSLDAALGCG